ncbi:MAG: NADH-quinone oxidoreductase subunit L [Acidobacteriota bacterium]|nr:NADH-quinone oxidoreductase subunit L [Acidobacteriota bacterium]
MTQPQHLSLAPSAAVLVTAPLLYALGGVFGQLARLHRLSVARAWTIVRAVSLASILLALALCADALFSWRTLRAGAQVSTIAHLGIVTLSFRMDLLTVLMLTLVTFLGWVITNYSRSYMSGDPAEQRYLPYLMGTLAAVSLLLVTNNLLLFLAAWVLTSLSLHGLLTLYQHRQAALIAAHKKFLASRMGDLTLLCAVLLLGTGAHSFEMDKILENVTRLHPVPTAMHLAAVLLAISAAVKCAQLPLHGWLIQVMEAPTPISALLHAGVVNLGGFMLIRLAGVLNTTPAAQTLLVILGSLTATLSALVMTTRISIKVQLAWSTCAQMGFMLMECGLGLYHLALLHLLAHSLYKAHAFLSSGGTVALARLKQMQPPTPATSASAWMVGTLLGVFAALFGAWLWHTHLQFDASAYTCILIVGLAIAGALANALATRTLAATLPLAAGLLAISALYFGLEQFFAAVVPQTVTQSQWHRAAFVAFCFALLALMQALVRIHPLGAVATALYPWFYAGLYMDELFTRTTFRVWPARPARDAALRRDAMQPYQQRGAAQ